MIVGMYGKSLEQCSPDEVCRELLAQTGLDVEEVRSQSVRSTDPATSMGGGVMTMGDHVRYDNGQWAFDTRLTIDLPGGTGVSPETTLDNLFRCGEHVYAPLWTLPTTEQACESAFEAIRSIEGRRGRRYTVPYSAHYPRTPPVRPGPPVPVPPRPPAMDRVPRLYVDNISSVLGTTMVFKKCHGGSRHVTMWQRDAGLDTTYRIQTTVSTSAASLQGFLEHLPNQNAVQSSVMTRRIQAGGGGLYYACIQSPAPLLRLDPIFLPLKVTNSTPGKVSMQTPANKRTRGSEKDVTYYYAKMADFDLAPAGPRSTTLTFTVLIKPVGLVVGYKRGLRKILSTFVDNIRRHYA